MYRICAISDIPADELPVARKLLRSYGIEVYETHDARADASNRLADGFLAMFAAPAALWTKNREDSRKAQELLANFLANSNTPFIKRRPISRGGQIALKVFMLVASVLAVCLLGYFAVGV